MFTAASVLNSPQPEGDRISHLGRGVHIQGKIFSEQDLQVDGEVDGTLVCEHNLGVGSRARVRADIKAQNVSIVGSVEGNIEGGDRVELCSQCRVVGQIKTRRIAIKDGAYFKGSIEVVQAAPVVAVRPAIPEIAVIEINEKETADPDSKELLATA